MKFLDYWVFQFLDYWVFHFLFPVFQILRWGGSKDTIGRVETGIIITGQKLGEQTHRVDRYTLVSQRSYRIAWERSYKGLLNFTRVVAKKT